MKRFAAMFAVALLMGLPAGAEEEKKEQLPPDVAALANAKKVETVAVPAQSVIAAYNYMTNFPAKDVMQFLEKFGKDINPQVKAGKKQVTVNKEYLQVVYNTLLKEQTVQLTIALQQVIQAPAPTPEKDEAPKKEKKSE